MPSDDPRTDDPDERTQPSVDSDPERRPASLPVRELEVLYPDDLDDLSDETEADDDEDGEFDDVRTVLITGASGNIGRKLRAAWDDVYDMVLIDTVDDPDDEIILADLSELDDGWITHFHGVDTVIHLAALPSPDATWDELQRPNIDAMANVLHACALAGVERVIFASSSHVMGGYADQGDEPITEDLPPGPDGPYGASKLVGERLGRSLARAFDITFIALRLGWIQPGENRPETLPNDAARSLWLSTPDLVQLMECAIETELDANQFLIVNGVSRNRGSRWDGSTAAEILGFTPEDDAHAGAAAPG